MNIVIVTYVTVRGDELGDGLLISSPNEKTIFRALGLGQGQNGLCQCLGLICIDFNTEKNYWAMLRKFCEKNVFVQKCDEIRRVDGMFFWSMYTSSQHKIWQLPFRLLLFFWIGLFSNAFVGKLEGFDIIWSTMYKEEI